MYMLSSLLCGIQNDKNKVNWIALSLYLSGW